MAKKQMASRLNTTLLDRMDAHGQWMTETTPGVEYSRVDVVRYLLTHAFNDLEKRPP